MESSLLILALVGVTSVGSYLLAVKGLRLSRGGVLRAVGKMLECVGMALVFVIVNVVGGMLVIFAAGGLTWTFVSPYLIGDHVEVLSVLSLLQGLVFQWWRES